MDYELDNVLIDDDGPIVIDWQSPMISHPGVDLAWLLAASHTEETLARRRLLETLPRYPFKQWGT